MVHGRTDTNTIDVISKWKARSWYNIIVVQVKLSHQMGRKSLGHQMLHQLPRDYILLSDDSSLRVKDHHTLLEQKVQAK